MKFQSLKLTNFTVFESCSLNFGAGINVFLGENGAGKTHVLKVLYSAAQAARPDISFSRKLVGTMQPDGLNLSRLLTRKKGVNSADLQAIAASPSGGEKRLMMKITRNTKKWDAEVGREQAWEKEFADKLSVFIPVREILSNCYNLPAAVSAGNIKFDDTYIDIINAAKIDISMGRDEQERGKLLHQLEKITRGKVTYDSAGDEFYLRVGQSKQEFNLIAEGIRKLSLLWQLVKNGTLRQDSVLFWDEPEANLNPACIPVVADFLIALQQSGVQIFIATHDYVLSKYLELKRKSKQDVLFHSLFYSDKAGKQNVQCETSPDFGALSNNPIMSSFEELLDEIYKD